MLEKNTDSNGDELVGEILDVIDAASSNRYQVALRIAEFIRKREPVKTKEKE